MNSPAMIATGRALLAKHGSWDAVRAASVRSDGGYLIIRPDSLEKLRQRAAAVRKGRGL